MDPMTAITIASSVVQGVGQIQQGNAAAGAASYNAKVASINANIAKQNAGFAGAEGESSVATEALKNRATTGATLANEGASGINVNKGSFTNVRTSEAEVGQLNAMQIRSNAARQAYGYQTQATSFENQAALDRAQASYDRQAGFINAGATVLGGVGQASLYSKLGAPATPDTYQAFLASTDPTAGLTVDTTGSLPSGNQGQYFSYGLND